MDTYTLSLEIYNRPLNELTDIEKKKVEDEIEEYIQTNGVGH